MRFQVLHSQWAAEDDVFAGGEHEVAKPSADFLRLLAGAEAAGSVVIVDASDDQRTKLDRHVQSQEDGEATYAAAVEAGLWQEGNLEQFELDLASGVRSDTLEVSADDVADLHEVIA